MVLLLNAFLIVSIDPKFYNWYIFVLMLWCHWVTPQWTMYVISHWFLFVYIMPFYVFYHIMFLCFRCWCTLSEMTRIKMINQSINQCLVVSTNKFPDLYLSHATSGDNGIITAPTGLQHVTQMVERGLHIEHGTVDIHLRHSSTVDWPSFAITPVCRNSLGWLPDVQWCHCSSCGPHLVLQALDGVAARTTTADSTRVLARFREGIILRYW